MTQFDIESITKTLFSWEIVATGKNGKKKYIGNVIDMLDPQKMITEILVALQR